jgi:hypothetical protein
LSDTSQYLRLSIEGKQFLLPSVASQAIEQREALILDGAAPPIAAWHQAKLQRWPAYNLDGSLEVSRRGNWQRAVFLDAVPYPIGFVVDEVQLITRGDIPVVPFVPLGPPPTSAGHLFNGAWVDGHAVTLVIDPTAMGAYLKKLGAAP